MTNPTPAGPQDDSTPVGPPASNPPAAPLVPPVPLAPPTYDTAPYVAPAAPAYDPPSYETAPYPEASAPLPPVAPPAYAPPAYPVAAYASAPTPYPVQTTPGAPPIMPYGYGGYAPRKTNGLAVASMILSILGIIWVLPFIGSLIGVILGHISLGQLKRTGEGGRGMALAGVIVGWVGLAIIVFVVLALVAFAAAGSGSSYSTYGG